MISSARKDYNASFTEDKYQQFYESLSKRFNKKIDFKVCETPVFIPSSLKKKLLQAGEEIIDVICRDDFKEITNRAVPEKYNVPNEDDKTLFLALDFGVCHDAQGEIIPQLIEMQGFSSLYGYQNELGKKYRQFFNVAHGVDYLFNGFNEHAYIDYLRQAIIGQHNSENVILLEIEPEKQKTWIDFWILKEMIGIEPVCISKVIREGRNLFYHKENKKLKIDRIYPRLIFDEFELRKDLQCQWHLTEEVNIEWAGHPNWFFRLSKFTLPFIKSKYVPETHFISELQTIPDDLENWVLKPLFSFAGSGVKFMVSKEDIGAVTQPENFILQRKVHYASLIKTPDVPAKFEVRLMYMWEKNSPRPTLVINLARLSKGVMIGVDFNKNKNWVGGTVGYFEN